MIYSFYDKLLQKLNVDNYSRVSEELCHSDFEFFYNYMAKSNEKCKTRLKMKAQIGGSKKKYKYKYEDNIFIIHEVDEDDRITINIYKNKSKDAYIIIFIPKDENYIYIHNISNYNERIISGMSKNGTLLMRMVLNFSTNILKSKYNCKYIQLKDNSFFWCDKLKKKIEFDNLYILTKGDTWYGKYNFIPFDPDSKQIDITNYVNYKTNQKIINIIKVKHVDLYRYISNAFIQLEMYNQKKLDFLTRLLEKHKNDTIRCFFSIFLKDYDALCNVFSLIYKDIMNELQMVNLHGITYYLPI
jgi:hypothetical protein